MKGITPPPQMTFGPCWSKVAALFTGRTEDDVKTRAHSATIAGAWNKFSSKVVPGVSLQVVRHFQAVRARAPTISTAATPMAAVTGNSIGLAQKVGGLLLR